MSVCLTSFPCGLVLSVGLVQNVGATSNPEVFIDLPEPSGSDEINMNNVIVASRDSLGTPSPNEGYLNDLSPLCNHGLTS